MKRTKRTRNSNETADAFLSPESSNVEGGSYYPESKLCVLAFRDKKNPSATTVYYYYENVPPEDYIALKNADSKGIHMRKVWKHKGRKVE